MENTLNLLNLKSIIRSTNISEDSRENLISKMDTLSDHETNQFISIIKELSQNGKSNTLNDILA